MVAIPADGAGSAGQFHANELKNIMLAIQFGCGVEDDSYTMTITEANRIVTIPAFNAVVPDGSGSYTLVKYAGGNATITAAHSSLPRVDIIVIDSAGTLAVTAGTPAAESTGSVTITDIDSVLGIVAEPPMPATASDEIMLAKVYAIANTTNIAAAVVWGRAVHTDIYRLRHLTGWAANDVQNPSLTNETGSNNLPVGVLAEIPILDVTEAFNSDGTDLLTVGYDADSDAFGLSADVSSTGPKNMAAGTLEGYVATVRAVEAYYVNGGTEPSNGKALVDLPYRFIPPIVS